MRVLSLFAGIGAFEKAMVNLNIPFELVGFSEIDKYAVKSYCAIHGVDESLNFGDITKIDETKLPTVDFITYGFPCQDISLAGKQKGLFNDDGTLTRSGLFFDALRIIEHCQPKVAIAENVKNLTGKKFAEQFKIVLDSLEAAGYNNYWKILNAKDYGIPQNRERVFIVSIRKDIDTGKFEFPEPYELKLRLKDMLEDVVDEKYYVSNDNTKKLLEHHKNILEGSIIGGMQKNQSVKNDGISTTLTSSMGIGGGYVPMTVEPVHLGNIYGEQFGTGYAGNVWDKEAISLALMTMQGGNRQPMIIEEPMIQKVGNVYPSGGQNGNVYDSDGISPTIISGETNTKGNGGIGSSNAPKILVREATKKGYAEAVEGDSINFEHPNSKTRRGRVGNGVAQTLTTSPQQGGVVRNEDSLKIKVLGNYSPSNHDASRIVDSEGLAPTVKENHGTVTATVHNLRIRKLTPKECFRLMGFDDEDFEKAEKVNSNTQLYKQAGNSIVVDVAEELLCMLFDEEGKFFV